MGRVYVVSAWDNPRFREVARILGGLRDGLSVFDFRHGEFPWATIDPRWREWTPKEYCKALAHREADIYFAREYQAMVVSDYCVLVQPSDDAALMEAGWFAGREDKRLYVLLDGGIQANVKHKLADLVTDNLEEIAEEILAEEEDGVSDLAALSEDDGQGALMLGRE